MVEYHKPENRNKEQGINYLICVHRLLNPIFIFVAQRIRILNCAMQKPGIFQAKQYFLLNILGVCLV